MYQGWRVCKLRRVTIAMPVFAVNNQLTYTHKLVITFSSTQYKKQNKEQSN